MDAALKVKLGADTSDLTKAMDVAEKGVDDFVKAASRATSAMAPFGATITVAAKSFDEVKVSIFAAADAFDRKWNPVVEKAQLEAKKAADEINKLKNSVSAFGGGVSSFKAPAYFDKVTEGATKLTPAAKKAGLALTDLSRIASDAPFGFIAIQNNISPLIESFGRLKTQTGGVKGALSAMVTGLTGPAGLGVAVALATGVLTVLSQRGFFDTAKAIDKTKESADEFKKSVEGIFSNAAKEATEVQSLIAVLNSETATRQRKLAAIQELQKINPEVFNGLKIEGGLVVGLDAAYQNYIANLKTVIAEKIKQQQLEKVTEEILKKEGATLLGNEKIAVEGTKRITDALAKREQSTGISGAATERLAKSEKEINTLYTQQKGLIDDIGKLQSGVKVDKLHQDKVKKVKEEISLQEQLRRIVDRNFKQEQALTAPTGTPTPGVSPSSGLGVIIPRRDFGLENGLQAGPIADKQKEMLDNQRAYNEALAKTNETAATLQPIFDSVFSSIAQGQNVFDALGNAIKALIGKLIAAAAAAFALSLVTGGIGGQVVGGQTVGGFTNFFKQLSGLGNLFPHAEGGIFTKPTRIGNHLFGESGAEALVPLTRSNEFMTNLMGNRNQPIEIYGQLANDVIYLSNKRAEQSRGRRF